MSEFRYLRSKYCACGSKRCDKATKSNLRSENNIEIINILNTVRNTILLKSNKQPNNTIINKQY